MEKSGALSSNNQIASIDPPAEVKNILFGLPQLSGGGERRSLVGVEKFFQSVPSSTAGAVAPRGKGSSRVMYFL